jgi:hypothetical protein
MIVWVLLIVSKTAPVQIWVNTFDSKTSCEQRIKRMEPTENFQCVETRLNK